MSEPSTFVVEVYRLDRYDNDVVLSTMTSAGVVEVYRLDRYDNLKQVQPDGNYRKVVEVYRLDRYDNHHKKNAT